MEVDPTLSEKARYDLNLVKSATEGDQKAFAELMRRYKDSLYYMLLRMVNNPSDAEDLTIESFGKAFNNISQYNATFAFSTWLFKIATNNGIDFLRKKKKNIVSLNKFDGNDDIGIIEAREPNPDPEEDLIKKQKKKLIRELVDQMKPRYRQLIEMRYFEDLSYEEISHRLDLPLGTIKVQLFRAKELLNSILNKMPKQ